MLTARTEFTDRMLMLSERHLRAVLAEYLRHCNGRRPHRSRELRPPQPTASPKSPVALSPSERTKLGEWFPHPHATFRDG
ncbi:transposase [Amycolatopsis thailandensis]|uniref:transposase n=1 Tax=Amycolatopsis thailandensis TaxID=589330 RepID=UPI001FC96E79|nr:transposase [Amycolatopsis thailandensis]